MKMDIYYKKADEIITIHAKGFFFIPIIRFSTCHDFIRRVLYTDSSFWKFQKVKEYYPPEYLIKKKGGK